MSAPQSASSYVLGEPTDSKSQEEVRRESEM